MKNKNWPNSSHFIFTFIIQKIFLNLRLYFAAVAKKMCPDVRPAINVKLFKTLNQRPATILKKRLWHRCFTVNFAK